MRTRFSVGDVFEVALGDGKVGYFQYVANDDTQLGSAVIRAFNGIHGLAKSPGIEAVVAQDVSFFAHVFLKAGLTLAVWRKVGRAPVPGNIDVLFRDSNDYGNPSVKISRNWYVWKINEPHEWVGRLPEKYHSAEIGVVKAPQEIAARFLTGSYGGGYPGF